MKHDHGRLLFKVFFTYLLTALIILGALFGAFKSLNTAPTLPAVLEQNIIWHLSNLRRELGPQPDQKQAQDFYNRFHLRFRMEGVMATATSQNGDPATVSPEALPTFLELDSAKDLRVSDNLRFGRTGKFFFAEVTNETPRLAWFVSPQVFQRNSLFPFQWIAGFILLILGMSFMSIRWIIKPLSLLFRGARELADGNLSFRMHTHRREFRSIARDFNEIAEKLERQIQNRDALLRDVSHELRSPLTRIGVAAELLQDPTARNSIREDVQRMNHLIHQILQSYQIRSGALSPKKVPMDIMEMIRTLQAEDKTLRPQLNVEGPQALRISADPMQIERCLRNLIENARKYSPANAAPIRIEVTESMDNSHTVNIAIEDHGAGIQPDKLEKIFEPFY